MAPTTPKPPTEKPAKPVRAAKPAKAATALAKAEKPAARRTPKAAAAKPAAKTVAKPATNTVKLRDLVDSVVAATGAKKPDAKKAVEAVLDAIGAGLAAKSMLVLPPLGKLRVVKANAGVMTLKLRLADASRAKGMALADDDEDS